MSQLPCRGVAGEWHRRSDLPISQDRSCTRIASNGSRVGCRAGAVGVVDRIDAPQRNLGSAIEYRDARGIQQRIAETHALAAQVRWNG